MSCILSAELCCTLGLRLEQNLSRLTCSTLSDRNPPHCCKLDTYVWHPDKYLRHSLTHSIASHVVTVLCAWLPLKHDSQHEQALHSSWFDSIRRFHSGYQLSITNYFCFMHNALSRVNFKTSQLFLSQFWKTKAKYLLHTCSLFTEDNSTKHYWGKHSSFHL